MSARVAESLAAIESSPRPNDKTRSLTIKTSTSGKQQQASSTVDLSAQSSPYYSPLISPPSSAFVSALQSPYISPRATLPPPDDAINQTQAAAAADALLQPNCGSQSEDIPSSSYTPPTDTYEYSDDPADPMLKYADRFQVPDSTLLPRVSFSFPVPRVSFAKGSISPPTANANKLRSCDVFIGFHGHNNNPNLGRFCKWMKSELEIQGIACFVADRAKYTDNQSHDIADRVICSVNYGIVVITASSFINPFSIEEIRFFAKKKNLIPVFFDVNPGDIVGLTTTTNDSSVDAECINALIKSHDFKLEAYEGNWRGCVAKAVAILRGKLGRKSVMEKEDEGYEELPFPRNRLFVGREKELLEMETSFFGGPDQDGYMPVSKEASGQSEGLADEESDVGSINGGYINLELGREREPKLEAWVEPVLTGRSSFRRPKYKKSKSGRDKCYGSSVVCINGVAGIGKTDLALEFAYRYSQRYKMVLWVGGETRYFRQNLLNLSLNLGINVSADSERERERIRSFEEQESEAFKRIKRELFRDIPYLLIIDNLENEKEWWEGKDLHDLIPRNTGGTHIIITTRLPKIMNFDIMQLPPLPLSEAMVLMRGRRKREYPEEERVFLRMFDDKLRRLTFGMSVVGSLLSELAISPSALFEAINRIPSTNGSFCSSILMFDEQIWKNNPFLLKVLEFCTAILETNGPRNTVALRMVLVGAWYAPAPISANLLAAAAKSMPHPRNSFGRWTKCLNNLAVCYGSSCCSHQTWKSEEDSAMLLVRLGLARKANRQESGCWIKFHPITRTFAKRKPHAVSTKAAVQGLRKPGCTPFNFDHAWACAFLVFGFKSEPPLVQLKPVDMVVFIKKTVLPLAITAFATFSRCTSALELLKVCTDVLEEVEKSFVSQIQDWCHASLCWTKKLHTSKRVDEFLWQEVTLLKATLLETRAKLLLRGGHFDSGEELCRTCISIRTVMLGHSHAQTLTAQETLAKLPKPSPSISSKKKASPSHDAALGSAAAQPVALLSHGKPDLKDAHSPYEDVLRQFDLNMRYGPSIGMTRLDRWERAKKLGMNPPNDIESLLRSGKVGANCVFEGRI
uniref:AAA+ ATPase domain-containing protein n=1 Tax=Kalanchoe fedtschenkoi TaxID=63787 RepID=A0A7N0TVA4_KALFE